MNKRKTGKRNAWRKIVEEKIKKAHPEIFARVVDEEKQSNAKKAQFTKLLDLEGQERFWRRVREQRQERERVRDSALKIIEAGFKLLSMKMHPDKGGSADAMRRLNEARSQLKGAI
jgi:hypothetical protein